MATMPAEERPQSDFRRRAGLEPTGPRPLHVRFAQDAGSDDSSVSSSPESSKASRVPSQARPGVQGAKSYPASARRWPKTDGVAVVLLALAGASALAYSIVLLAVPGTLDLSYMLTLLGIPSASCWGPVLRPRSQNFDTTHITTSLLTRALPIGRRDFALQSAGGIIFSDLTSSAHPSSSAYPPDTVISDDFRLAGCWRIPGSHLQIGVVLSETIYPSHFTLDHFPKLLAHDIGKAPRKVILWGVVDGSPNQATYSHLHDNLASLAVFNRSGPPMQAGYTFVPLAVSEYDPSIGPHVQTFPVHREVVESGIDIGLVVLDVLGNWGADATQLCRLRVHGTPREYAHTPKSSKTRSVSYLRKA